jgi:hypothetical protein
VSGVDGLLARVAPGFFQQAYVVADLEAAMAACRATLGASSFATLPPTMLPYRYRGAVVECSLAIGFARSGDVQLELIQPVAGAGLHAEHLATRGSGFHHLGFLVDDLDAERAAATDAGFPEVTGGEFGSLRFAYLDTAAALGVYVELVEDPDGMMHGLMPWRD